MKGVLLPFIALAVLLGVAYEMDLGKSTRGGGRTRSGSTSQRAQTSLVDIAQDLFDPVPPI
jgi:hypothetical protein